MSYYSPAPTPAPEAAPNVRLLFLGSIREWLKALGPYVAIAVAVLYLRASGRSAQPPAPPDRIELAAKAWRKAEGLGYHTVAEKIRTGQIDRLDQVEPALKEAFLPAAKEVTDSVSGALKALTDDQGHLTNSAAAADVFDRAAKAFGVSPGATL
jgi:hypothetical protein